jgi:ABC-type amino acid transport substrate-binding protein
MDLLKNRETPNDGIPRRLPADTAEGAVITEIRRVLQTPETTAQVIAVLDRMDIPEAEAIAALQHFPKLWDQLFPGEQARIIQLLVRRVTVTAEGLVIDLRTDGIAGVMREMMTSRQIEAAE